MNQAAPVPLWRQLLAAADVVARVRAGESGSAAVAQQAAALRPAAQALSYQTLRRLGLAQALRRQLAQRAPPPRVDALLSVALALASQAEEPEGAPYEPFTLVNQAVEAAKHDSGMRNQSGFVNGCLRRFLRERDALLQSVADDPVARWNYPQWWISRLRREYPEHWQDILQAGNQIAPMTLRVNARRSSQQAYLQRLRDAGIEARATGRDGIILAEPRNVAALPGFADGLASVQDGGAQLAARLLADAAGRDAGRLRILDACAAPGGKTAHLLELLDAQVTALDVDPARCQRIHENLQRLGLAADVRAVDAGNPAAWWDGQPFDAILLDAPCTASGIVRRHPDVRWLRRETDIAQLAREQARLLKALWPLLREGGHLLYCTCSVFRAEGQEQIQTFVAHNKQAALRPAPGHLMPQNEAKADRLPDNDTGDHDGFFYALLEKRAEASVPA